MDGGPSGAANMSNMIALMASGVALGGMLVLLGFMSGQALNENQQTQSRRRRRKDPSEDEDSAEEEPPTQVARRKMTTMAVRKSLAEMDETMAVALGFSMEEALQQAEALHVVAKQRTPQEVLSELQRGNARFWTGQASRPEGSAFERRALISKQFPSVAILGCSDSRVPIEIVFDQGLGDMFVIRVAGNCLDTTTQASLEYAVKHLKVKVLIVLGHEGCGAVKAAQLPDHMISKEPETLAGFLRGMKQGLARAEVSRIRDSKAADREAVTANVKVQVEKLTKDQSIMAKIRSEELMMLGAFYEISSGIVDFFHEVSGEEEEVEPIQRNPSRGVLTRYHCEGAASPGKNIKKEA